MNSPIIGITTGREQTKFGSSVIGSLETYIKTIRDANGIPLLIPLGISESFLDVFIKLSKGVLFTGGGDFHPNSYNGDYLPSISSVDQDRDRVELYIFNQILELRKPFLGICRGIQLINIALGGTLYEDIHSQVPNALKHQNFPDNPANFLAHDVDIISSSYLADIMKGIHFKVNSTHHQAIKKLANNLNSIALAPDGIIEAVMLKNYNFGIGVQWHPERLQDQVPMRNIFRAFIIESAK